jgi:hypothetical protein
MPQGKGTRHKYYVYVYFRPNGVPCYVGLGGTTNRWLWHEKEPTNAHLWNIIQKAGGSLPKLKVREGLTKAEAIETEKALINAIGRRDLKSGPLVNRTDGGDGIFNPSKSTRRRIGSGQSQLGQPRSLESREKRRQTLSGRKRPRSVAKKISMTWRKKFRTFDPTLLAKAYLDGMSCAAAGKQFGIKSGLSLKILKELSIQRRSGREAQVRHLA